eukprot:g21963.t1
MFTRRRCSMNNESAEGTGRRDVDEADVARLVEECNRFACRLYRQLSGKSDDNLFFSPGSISLALAMTFAGAAGETADEMVDALGISLPAEQLHEAFRQLQEQTRTGEIELQIANRLWGHAGYPFLDSFLRTTERCYHAELKPVDFENAAEEARLEINAWVAEQTAGKITELIPPQFLEPDTRLILTNAIYFLGVWEQEFNEQATVEAPFHTAAGESQNVPMMRKIDTLRYGEFDRLQVLELPYRSEMSSLDVADSPDEHSAHAASASTAGSDFCMCILLPESADGITELEQQIASAGLSRWTTLHEVDVDVSLPRFRLEASFRVDEAMKSLGMKRAFSRADADFSKMTDDPVGLFIDAILHKAFVDVNEMGTEAAAATGVIMVERGLPPQQPKIFRADRPFVFLIRDRATGLVHFMGSVKSPPDAG